jgi:hypothetical protein
MSPDPSPRRPAQALQEMHEAGFKPDATVFTCLLAALPRSSSDNSSYQASQAMAMLDWNKIRQGSFSPDKGPRPISLRLDVRLAATPKVFKDAFQAFRRIGTPSMASTFWGMSPSSARGDHTGDADRIVGIDPSPRGTCVPHPHAPL